MTGRLLQLALQRGPPALGTRDVTERLQREASHRHRHVELVLLAAGEHTAERGGVVVVTAA